MNPSSRDAGIPILTEVISAAPVDERQDAPAQTSVPISPSTAASAEAPLNTQQHTVPVPGSFEEEAISRLSEEDWYKLERRIRERILRQIFAKVDAVLEQRIRDSLADVLQLALEDLTTKIRGGLHQSLEDVISRAISQEIARLQSTKK